MANSDNSDRPSILILEAPGRKPLGSAISVVVATHGWQTVFLTSPKQAIEAITKQKNLRAVVCNDPDIQVLETARAVEGVKTILVTELPMQEYASALQFKDENLLDHIVANLDSEWTSSDLAITLKKILMNDIFGLEKYLSSEAQIQEHIVKSSVDREPLNKLVADWVESCGVAKNVARLAHGVSEELLMNAIYDAPVAGGRAHYELLERTSKRELQSDEWATLKFGMDHRLFGISVSDPFGAFLREKWFSYLRKAMRRNDSSNLIDTKKGGAGLGLFKMLYSSHGVVCNVESSKQTEVIVLININTPVRDFIHMPRSIHYFKK